MIKRVDGWGGGGVRGWGWARGLLVWRGLSDLVAYRIAFCLVWKGVVEEHMAR